MVWGISFPLIPSLLRCLRQAIGKRGRMYFVLCAIWIYHVPIIIFEEIIPVELLFWGKFPLERATSFFYYRKGSDFRRILHLLKYGGQKEIGAIMGRYMAAELIESGFFQGIDVIIPIPLHETKQRIRGYNQSEWIARGIAAVTGIPVDTEAVVRRKYTETQTRKSIFERWENVEGIFELHHAESLIGKHVLIVDDVLTTGATTVACASRIMEVEGIRISVLTLAVAD